MVIQVEGEGAVELRAGKEFTGAHGGGHSCGSSLETGGEWRAVWLEVY